MLEDSESKIVLLKLNPTIDAKRKLVLLKFFILFYNLL